MKHSPIGPMRKYKISLVLGILPLLLFQGVLVFRTPAMAASDLEKSPEKSILVPLAKSSGTLKTSENSILEEIKGVKWKSSEATAQPVQWLELIGHVEKNDSEIQMSREKITETEAKREDVEMKRVLFFFKYFDSGFLEGSAESDVVAVSAHAQGVLQATLLQCAHKYYGLVRSILMQYIAFQSIEEGKTQLSLNQQRFTMGQSTNFEVLETESNLIRDYQEYLQAGIGYRVASFALAEQMNLKNKNPQELFSLYPVELTFQNNDFQFPEARYFSTASGEAYSLKLEELLPIALAHRPELKEIKFRRISLENLYKATTVKFNRVQEKILRSSLKQMDWRKEKLEGDIQTALLKAFEEYQFAQEKLRLAYQQRLIAEKAFRQVKIAQVSGFSSNKEVLDAQASYSRARANQINALLDHHLSQLQLLYELGLLSVETLKKGRVEL